MEVVAIATAAFILTLVGYIFYNLPNSNTRSLCYIRKRYRKNNFRLSYGEL